MKIMLTAAFLTFGFSFGAQIIPASADTLSALQSACRTGVYTACSQYNAAVIARNAVKNPALTQGFDPFAIQLASHSERTPKASEPLNAQTPTPSTSAVTVNTQ